MTDTVSFPYLSAKNAAAETVYELTSAEREPEWGIAVADIGRSELHVHHKTSEIYVVVEGAIDLTLDTRVVRLGTGESAEIRPGVPHRACSRSQKPARVVVVTLPAWTAADHIPLEGRSALSPGIQRVTKSATKLLPDARDDVAPDGSDVRILLGLPRGGMAHFELAPDQTSRAVTHRTVEEIWYFVSGRGQMWRSEDGESVIVDVHAGVCLTIPVGTHFQFRSTGDEPLAAIGVTMPPWPGRGEAIYVDGAWTPTVAEQAE